MAEKTYDIRVAIEWGEWVDDHGARRRVSAHPGPCGAFERQDVCVFDWVAASTPGLPPYRHVPREPAPARLWECERDGRLIRQRSNPGRRICFGDFGVLVRENGPAAVLDADDLDAIDWEHETEPGSGVFVSPNGWEDDDG